MQHDIGRVLMAISNLNKRRDAQFLKGYGSEWQEDARGYPVPGEDLERECERLRVQELMLDSITAYNQKRSP